MLRLHKDRKVTMETRTGRDGTFFDSAGTLYKTSLMLLFSVTPFSRLFHSWNVTTTRNQATRLLTLTHTASNPVEGVNLLVHPAS